MTSGVTRLGRLQAMSPGERARFGRELARNAALHPDSHHTQELLGLFLSVEGISKRARGRLSG